MNILNEKTSGINANHRILEMEEKISRYARVSHYVLITGERGTGKTTIAKRLHEQSARAKKEFINLNCANLTQELLESELFGYEKGAFTGATAPKMGLFEIANGGTLFLDEIGEIPCGLQAKLLKAVEEKRIRRVGSNIERTVDTRIMAATSQDLKQMVKEGGFRADLYDRLNILTLETVPLRFQKEKIKDLLETALNRECSASERTYPFEISEDALLLLELYDWQGNFRELNNTATRLAVECLDEPFISVETVRRVLGDRISHIEIKKLKKNYITRYDFRAANNELVTVSFDPKTDDLDSIYLKAAGNFIEYVLSQNDGNLRQTARKLNTTHTTLTRILERFNPKCEVRNFPITSETRTKFALAS